jgi:coenzyme F420-reducing hydrogenase beta subunit
VKEFLEQGRLVLFSGTLCQIAGLKAFLHKDYPNLYLVDVVCYGVPAPEVWDAYIDSLEKKYNGKVTKVSFRDKRNGWSDYIISVKFDNGKEYINCRSEDLYMRGFLHDCFLRPACYQCDFKGLNRASDITLGDLWGIDHIVPQLNDDKGTSLVMISSERGKLLFDKVLSDMIFQIVKIEDVVKYNPAIEANVHTGKNNIAFERDFGNKPITVLLNQYCSKSVIRKLMQKIRTAIKRR